MLGVVLGEERWLSMSRKKAGAVHTSSLVVRAPSGRYCTGRWSLWGSLTGRILHLCLYYKFSMFGFFFSTISWVIKLNLKVCNEKRNM